MSGITELLAASRRAAKRADYYTTGEGKLFNALADAFELPAVPSEDVDSKPTIGGNDRDGGPSENEQKRVAVGDVFNLRVEVVGTNHEFNWANVELESGAVVAASISGDLHRLPVPVETEWEYSTQNRAKRVEMVRRPLKRVPAGDWELFEPARVQPDTTEGN